MAWELEKWDGPIEYHDKYMKENNMDSHERVRQPGHYKVFPDTDVIDLIKKCLTEEEFKGFCKGNILKYRLRDEEDILEDFAKSKEYKRYLQGFETPEYTGSIPSPLSDT